MSSFGHGEFSIVSAVGRNHYVCLRRLDHAHGHRDELFVDRDRERDLDRIRRALDTFVLHRDGLMAEQGKAQYWKTEALYRKEYAKAMRGAAKALSVKDREAVAAKARARSAKRFGGAS